MLPDDPAPDLRPLAPDADPRVPDPRVPDPPVPGAWADGVGDAPVPAPSLGHEHPPPAGLDDESFAVPDAEGDPAPGWQALGALSPGGLLPDDLSQLRALLVGPEQAEIARLRRRLRQLEARRSGSLADALAEALPDAVVENDRQGPRLSQALAPTVRQSLQVAVREDPEPVAQALFPVIGPAIRRAVTEAMRSMTGTINQTLERSLSLQSVAWRVEAARTGRPFSEIALAHMLRYRVEQVFLIDRETGLPHLHVVAEDVPEPDAPLFAGMLTAIRDFVRDTLGDRTDTLGRLQMGETEVWIEPGPSAYVAAVVRGVPPPELRGTLAEVVEAMHLRYAAELAQPPGAVSFDPARPTLSQALSRELHASRQGLHPLARLVLGAALVALLVWAAATAWRAWAWRDAVSRLQATPGVLVTHAPRAGGTGRVEGLVDPLAGDLRAVVRASRWKDRPVTFALRPFVALEPAFVAARAHRLLQPPSSVTLALRADTLVIGGAPPADFVARARRDGLLVPGVGHVAIAAPFAAERARMEALAATLTATELAFAPATTDPLPPARWNEVQAAFVDLQRLADTTGIGFDAAVVGYASPEGTDAFNREISRQRAVRLVERLAAQGVARPRLRPSGAGVDAAAAPERQRRVTFRVVVDPPSEK